MATVTPQMIKDIRESTGAGMTDCKKALDEAQGDMEKAIVFLRERGLAAAQKKAGRAASEGIVSAQIAPDCSRGFIVEVNCETDFVTLNDEFKAFVANVNTVAANPSVTQLDNLLNANYPTGGTTKDVLTTLIAKIGENIMVRRYVTMGTSNTYVGSYVHGGGKIGVLVELAGDNIRAHASNPELAETAKNIALQVAAMKPIYVNRASVPAQVLEQEKEVFFNQYRNQGKPEAALPKIVANRIETWFKEGCLVEQPFVKDENKNVGAMIAEVGKKLGIANLQAINYTRIELGEGVEKKSGDFAAEVASQIASAHK